MKCLLFFIVAFVVIIPTIKSQQSAGLRIAVAVAQKMTDSLGLTLSQKQQILNINTQILEQKTVARSQQASSDSLRIQIQSIERKRDSLYKMILGEEKFILYKKNKVRFITAQP